MGSLSWSIIQLLYSKVLQQSLVNMHAFHFFVSPTLPAEKE